MMGNEEEGILKVVRNGRKRRGKVKGEGIIMANHGRGKEMMKKEKVIIEIKEEVEISEENGIRDKEREKIKRSRKEEEIKGRVGEKL